ncbi:hypothetical protein N482_24520 [Pseudoalteromonas luteoviolacea NCIMB 1942]|uniref:Uncharacterized protein n=1 Tax=Pseudoalteromonas luteoviolacea NCIMB 1942 TaxID=1365253 RepID=A0A167G9L7_9GAMM|nr:hypothetical protein N482_24520 [Pseudoalteromonas luteoviolacea NCIMB 1942]
MLYDYFLIIMWFDENEIDLMIVIINLMAKPKFYFLFGYFIDDLNLI